MDGAEAALPQDWSSIRVYFGITLILSLIGWTFLARAVRGRFLSMREEEFVLALWLLLPGVIVTVLALSFLGDGLRDAAECVLAAGNSLRGTPRRSSLAAADSGMDGGGHRFNLGFNRAVCANAPWIDVG